MTIQEEEDFLHLLLNYKKNNCTIIFLYKCVKCSDFEDYCLYFECEILIDFHSH